jgi:hypothetical protein
LGGAELEITAEVTESVKTTSFAKLREKISSKTLPFCDRHVTCPINSDIYPLNGSVNQALCFSLVGSICGSDNTQQMAPESVSVVVFRR